MSKFRTPWQQKGLHTELYTEEQVWTDEITELFTEVDPDVLGDQWRVNDTRYKTGRSYRAMTDDNYDGSDKTEKVAQFAYSPSDHAYRGWAEHSWSLWVTYGTPDVTEGVEKRLDESSTPVRRSLGVDEYEKPFSDREEYDERRYLIGGLLADPLITNSVEVAARHLEDQLEEVARRVEYNVDLETVSSRNPDNELYSPTFVGGVGEKGTRRLAKHFGVYSNLQYYEADYIRRCPSSAYGNTVSMDSLIENIESMVIQYLDALEKGKTRTDIHPEDMIEYPKQQPKWTRRGDHVSHTDSSKGRGGDAEGDKFKSDVETDSSPDSSGQVAVGSFESVKVRTRADGYWVLSPLHPEDVDGFEMIVPFGTEQNERKYLESQHDAAPEKMYIQDAYVVMQVLEFVWDSRNEFSDEINTFDDIPTNIDVRSPTDDFEVEDVAPLLLSAASAYAGTSWNRMPGGASLNNRRNPETAYLRDCVTDEFAGKLSVSGSRKVSFTYLPGDMSRTQWIRETNSLEVEYKRPHVPEPVDKTEFSGEVYVVSGVLVEPFASESIARVLAHVKTQLPKISEGTELNRDIEKLYLGDGFESDYQTQFEVFEEIDGISTWSIKDLAESYGTYLALFESEDDEVSISSTTYDGGIERLQSCLQDAILEYQDQNESREPSTV